MFAAALGNKEANVDPANALDAVAAFPESEAVIVPAEKLPDSS